MHGQGNFFDPRLDDADASSRSRPRTGFGARRDTTADLDHARSCPALQFYQLAMPAPTPPAGSFDARRRGARQGRLQRQGDSAPPATCRRCSPSRAGTCTRAAEIGIDDFQANRSPDGRYRTTPLGACGRTRRAASTTTAASRRSPTSSTTTTRRSTLGLTDAEKTDLVEYLKSL